VTTLSSLCRWLCAGLLAVTASGATVTSLAAQDSGTPLWAPGPSSIGVGLFRFVGDGESSTRVGAYLYPRANARLTATGRFWDLYNVLEAEARWLRRTSTSPRPFLSASAIWQDHAGKESVGGTLGLGVELYPTRRLAFELTLAWQSLFAETPYSDNQWFRIAAGFSVIPVG
jgi:hypothetical protein